MTMPMLRVAHGRINEIQSQFRRNMPTTSSFADTLKAAEAEAALDGAYVVRAMAAPSTAQTAVVPFGILGTPITLTGSTCTSVISGDWKDSLPATGRPWADEIEAAAGAAGLDPRLLAAMVWQESGFDPDAVSTSGAIGLTQLMPATAAGLGVDPGNAAENLVGGARYLSWAIDEFGSIELGLAAYNAGPSRVREAGGIPDISETRAYVPAVLDYYRQLGGVA